MMSYPCAIPAAQNTEPLSSWGAPARHHNKTYGWCPANMAGVAPKQKGGLHAKRTNVGAGWGQCWVQMRLFGGTGWLIQGRRQGKDAGRQAATSTRQPAGGPREMGLLTLSTGHISAQGAGRIT
jgi:hypothetical protein